MEGEYSGVIIMDTMYGKSIKLYNEGRDSEIAYLYKKENMRVKNNCREPIKIRACWSEKPKEISDLVQMAKEESIENFAYIKQQKENRDRVNN